jgi:hypothetical protein
MGIGATGGFDPAMDAAHLSERGLRLPKAGYQSIPYFDLARSIKYVTACNQ